MSPPGHSGVIAWFARNPVAANLLMAVILLVGTGSAFTLQRALFPAIEIDLINIVVSYPGAAPEEVEKGLVLRIEEAINDLDGIKRVESDALESMASILIEPQDGVELRELLDDVKNRVDAIQHLPEEAEEPIISQLQFMVPALMLQITGDLDERSMKVLAESIRRDLLTHPEVSRAEIFGAREYEIGIEISEELLREYHLTLGEVARIIATSSLDLPAGSVQTPTGDIMLRTIGQAYVQQDFESIVLRTWPDGTRLLLGDIASVNDGFEEVAGFSLFDDRYSVGVRVSAVGDQDIIETAAVVKEYVARKRPELPPGVDLQIWVDSTYYLKGRLATMLQNLALGALLVFLTLALFLEIKLAFWVMVGIPVCFLGAMAVINTPYIGASLNMVSLFGFILVLGIVVDDAIIIGESAYAEQERHGHSVESVIRGAYRVATPATFGVLTTIVAFLPTLFVQGAFAPIPQACGWVVIFCLLFSLVESKWILPAHLAHSKPTRSRLLLRVDRVQERVNEGLRSLVQRRYLPLMGLCIRWRYFTLAAFLALLVASAGLLTGGVVRTVISPEIPGEYIEVDLRMAPGTSEARTLEALQQVADALGRVQQYHRQKFPGEPPMVSHIAMYGGQRTSGRLVVELSKEDQRSLSTRDIEQRWREEVGLLHGAEVFSISSSTGPSFGPAIAFDLKHEDFNTLRAAAEELEDALRRYNGLYDIRNGASDTADEIHLDILPEAEALGLTRYDLGSQVRHAFYGAEAQRIQRGIDEIKVMVRYPRQDRENIGSLTDMYIRTPGGDPVPIETVARVSVEQGLLKATHINYQRAAEVTAEANKNLVEPARIIAELEQQVLPGLLQKYPGLSYGISGMADEEKKAAVSMIVGFGLALFGIYALLAVPTRSYLQPLIIMGVIPFGTIGAIVGHWLTGFPVSMMSLMGIIALSGVVVNDSLILVDFANREVAAGRDRQSAMMAAGARRLRAILLTSLTTFFGLAPMLLERSAQALEIVPMAVSLAFGIVFATVITLLLVPCLYLILGDLASLQQRRRKDTGTPVTAGQQGIR